MELAERGKLRPDTRRLYVCDPNKNTTCKKNGCSHIHSSGKCYLTFDPEFAKIPDIPKEIIISAIKYAFNHESDVDLALMVESAADQKEICEYLTQLVEMDFFVLRRDV